MAGMWQRLKRWWPVGKAVLTVAVLAAVAWQFARILQDPKLSEEDPLHRPALQILGETVLHAHPGWLAASALLYVTGLGFSAFFWFRLLRVLGQKPDPVAAARAYYVGHLGKYVPGKAWALLLRTTLVSGPDVRPSVAAMTAVYETLTTMAMGALLAAVLLTWLAADSGTYVWQALGLLALAGIPILPGVFNFLVRRSAAPFLRGDAQPLPAVRTPTLLFGLALGGCGWVLLGTSLWAVLEALRPESAALEGATLARCIAFLALAYVAGFLALPAPGGLGVRELILQQFLEPELGPLPSLVAVLLLRLLWTAAEAGMAGALYWLPSPWASKKEDAAVPEPDPHAAGGPP